ncbi:MAG: hypothetical protein ACOYM3_32405 [Terrimicrobiaceae bacterium]
MKTSLYPVSNLTKALQQRKIATMEELKKALGTQVDMTVFRKLREIEYCTSYSHRGKFYALKAVADFDPRGLWTWREVHFSRFGSLVETAEHFVLNSARGLRSSELSGDLQVETKEALLTLVSQGRVVRESIAGCYVYFSPDAEKRRLQALGRQLPDAYNPFVSLWDSSGENPEETRAAIILFFSTLNERQRRLFAGLEALRLGRGGDSRIAEMTGMDIHTVARGRRELQSGSVEEGVRRSGGGRRFVEKKSPE